jgi:hypothetical protein
VSRQGYSSSSFDPHCRLHRIHCHTLHLAELVAITEIPSSIRQSPLSTVVVLVYLDIIIRRLLISFSRVRLFPAPSPPLPPGPAGVVLPLLYRVRATPSSRLHSNGISGSVCLCLVAYSPCPTFQTASSRPPVTPRRSYYKSAPLPSSSPAMSTPSSSPARPIVNIVSSPGPMGPEPTEEEYDDLPFKLPPGPYSHSKPDLPYAALIGQAILASPEHRLTLQEIYDFITIVYPHFKRNEQTWMNSIRHVLSTTIVFRKVQRDRAAGRTLWAIFDQDLDCFVGGGFRKEFCADMQEQREKARHSNRKRSAEDTPTRKPRRKKLKTEASQEQMVPSLHPQMGIPMSTLPAVAYPGPTMFPGPRPGTHHQPYYAPYVMPHLHAVPAGVIFPVLPPGSVYNPATTEPSGSHTPGFSALPLSICYMRNQDRAGRVSLAIVTTNVVLVCVPSGAFSK